MYCLRYFLALLFLPHPTSPPFFLLLFLLSMILHHKPWYVFTPSALPSSHSNPTSISAYCSVLLIGIYSSTCWFDISSEGEGEVKRCFFNLRGGRDFFEPQVWIGGRDGTGRGRGKGLEFLSMVTNPSEVGETGKGEELSVVQTSMLASPSMNYIPVPPIDGTPICSTPFPSIPSPSPSLPSSTSSHQSPSLPTPFLQRTLAKTPLFQLVSKTWSTWPKEWEVVRKGIGFRFYWGWEPPRRKGVVEKGAEGEVV